MSIYQSNIGPYRVTTGCQRYQKTAGCVQESERAGAATARPRKTALPRTRRGDEAVPAPLNALCTRARQNSRQGRSCVSPESRDYERESPRLYSSPSAPGLRLLLQGPNRQQITLSGTVRRQSLLLRSRWRGVFPADYCIPPALHSGHPFRSTQGNVRRSAVYISFQLSITKSPVFLRSSS